MKDLPAFFAYDAPGWPIILKVMRKPLFKRFFHT